MSILVDLRRSVSHLEPQLFSSSSALLSSAEASDSQQQSLQPSPSAFSANHHSKNTARDKAGLQWWRQANDVRWLPIVLSEYLRCWRQLPQHVVGGPLAEDVLVCLLCESTTQGRRVGDLANACSQLIFQLLACLSSFALQPTEYQLVSVRAALCTLAYLQSPWAALLPTRRATLRRRAGEVLARLSLDEAHWEMLAQLPATSPSEDALSSKCPGKLAEQWLIAAKGAIATLPERVEGLSSRMPALRDGPSHAAAGVTDAATSGGLLVRGPSSASSSSSSFSPESVAWSTSADAFALSPSPFVGAGGLRCQADHHGRSSALNDEVDAALLLEGVPLAASLVQPDDFALAERAFWTEGGESAPSLAVELTAGSPARRRRLLRPPRPPSARNGAIGASGSAAAGAGADDLGGSVISSVASRVNRMLQAAQSTRGALLRDVAKLGGLAPTAEDSLASVASALRLGKALSWSGTLAFWQEMLFLAAAVALILFTTSLILGTIAVA